MQSLEKQNFPLLPYNVMGIQKLRSLLNTGLQNELVKEHLRASAPVDFHLDGLDQLVESLTAEQDHGLIMTMGKGGVGKTLTASAIAVLIAQKGFDVHLTTTDPAAHVQDFMNQVKELPFPQFPVCQIQ